MQANIHFIQISTFICREILSRCRETKYDNVMLPAETSVDLANRVAVTSDSKHEHSNSM